MKKQFKALAILIVCFLASGFSPNGLGDETNNGKERIEVSFNRTMNFDDLVKIRLVLAEKGISIDYKSIEFDKNGGLESLGFEVDCNDGFSGTAKNTNITNRTEWGFYRDYDENATSVFGTGALDK